MKQVKKRLKVLTPAILVIFAAITLMLIMIQREKYENSPAKNKVVCPAGKYLENDRCIKCPVGYYCTYNNKRMCPEGTTTTSTGTVYYHDCH